MLLAEKCVYERAYLLISPHTFDSIEIDPAAAISSRLPCESNLLSLPGEKKAREFELLEAIEGSLRADEKLKAFAHSLLFLDLICEGLSGLRPSREIKAEKTPELLKEIFD